MGLRHYTNRPSSNQHFPDVQTSAIEKDRVGRCLGMRNLRVVHVVVGVLTGSVRSSRNQTEVPHLELY